MTEVVPGLLFVGSFDESFDKHQPGWMDAAGITHVLNVAEEIEVAGRLGREYLKLGVLDDDDRDDLAAVLDHALAFVEGARSRGGTVLVHCLEGKSRSVCVAAACAAALLREGSAGFDRVLRDIRRRRPSIDPWPLFEEQARTWAELARHQRMLGMDLGMDLDSDLT